MNNLDATTSDVELVGRARQGETPAFEALVRRHYRAAFGVAHAILGRRADAEDVCQDAWVKALEKLDSCRSPERFVFWLLQIVRNAARNRLDARRVRTTESLDAGAEAAAPEDPRRDLHRDRLRTRLEEALAGIPDVQRQIVLLHDMDGWSHRDIAESLGISEVMSRQHLFQARRRLRGMLGPGALGEFVS